MTTATKMPNLPTFMVVGAARCGTTTLFQSLNAHPDICAPTKETFFVAPEMARRAGRQPVAPTLREYAEIFQSAGGEQAMAIGEVSSCYLYGYRETVPRIREQLGDIQIVIILRDPAERAFSNYLFVVRDLRERRSFRSAVNDELQGGGPEVHWGQDYVGMGFYHDQVEAFLDAFSSVRVFLYDDLVAEPSKTVSGLFRSLGADPSFSLDLDTRFNASGVPRSRLLHRLLFRPTPARLRARQLCVSLLGERRVARIIEASRRRTLRRDVLDFDLRRRLCALYRSDIRRLESLIGRDLSGWMD